MPIPVTPGKSDAMPLTCNDSKATTTTDPSDPCVVAGYEDCLRETIRFLVQEEKLPEEHPLVSGLNFHLAADTAHKELLRVSDQLAKKLSEELRSTIEEEGEDDSGMESSFSDEDEVPIIPTAPTYKITLQECEEDDGHVEEEIIDEDYCMEEDISDDEGAEDIITAKDILSHPFLRNELIKLVFQGNDLVASPTISS